MKPKPLDGCRGNANPDAAILNLERSHTTVSRMICLKIGVLTSVDGAATTGVSVAMDLQSDKGNPIVIRVTNGVPTRRNGAASTWVSGVR